MIFLTLIKLLCALAGAGFLGWEWRGRLEAGSKKMLTEWDAECHQAELDRLKQQLKDKETFVELAWQQNLRLTSRHATLLASAIRMRKQLRTQREAVH